MFVRGMIWTLIQSGGRHLHGIVLKIDGLYHVAIRIMEIRAAAVEGARVAFFLADEMNAFRFEELNCLIVLVAGLLVGYFGGLTTPAAIMTGFAGLSIFAMCIGRETRNDLLSLFEVSAPAGVRLNDQDVAQRSAT
jgi:hypothetical protein